MKKQKYIDEKKFKKLTHIWYLISDICKGKESK